MPELDAAEAYLAQGDLESAVLAFGAAGADDGRDARALVDRGGVRLSLGRLAQAQADFEAAAALDVASPWPLLRLADMLSASGRAYSAARALGEAVARAPHLDEVRINAARGFFILEQLDLAYAAVRGMAAELPGWWAGARDRIVELFHPHHRHARNLLRELRADLCGAPRSLELAQTLAKVGRLALAEHMARTLLERAPGELEPLLLLARVRARRDGAAAGAAALREGGGPFADDPRFRRALLELTHDAGDAAGALALLSPEPGADDTDASFLIRAVGLVALGRRDALRPLCRAWLGVSPHSVSAAAFIATAALKPRLDVADQGAGDLRGVVLAQFWDRPEPPEDVRRVMESWTTHHPGLAVRRFDADSAREHLRSAFGAETAAVFDLCRHAAMKADLFRLGWLLSDGGVWADADELCLRPMGPLLAWAARQELTAPLSGEVPGYVHNLFLGAHAGSRAIEAAFEQACTVVDREVRRGVRPDIWHTTGPGLITRIAAERLLSWTGGEGARGIGLISSDQYRHFVRTEHALAYKSDPSANWHTA